MYLLPSNAAAKAKYSAEFTPERIVSSNTDTLARRGK
jgi:hypothetical protein